MKWTKEAEAAISKVPFFVRKRVKKRVEEHAVSVGAGEVSQEHVAATRKKFLKSVEAEVKGYQIETCFGPGGCPNRAVVDDILVPELERLLSGRNLREFLKARVKGPLKFHHEFRVTLADCPNACSQPQIVDVGLIGAVRPRVSDESCNRCGACVSVCQEVAINFPEEADAPVLDQNRCVCCGQCVGACPTGTIEEDRQGTRILVGGKLGRHPQLARELEGVFSTVDVLRIVNGCLEYYFAHNVSGERFGEILNRREPVWFFKGAELERGPTAAWDEPTDAPFLTEK
jgi:dissimilatory sulfite reductase (desulfoviridin) alpha/beta subunit